MRKIEDAVRELGGVWPSDDADAVYLYRIDDRYIAGLEGGTAPYICTRTEFEECTRRLRNEPSFDDHPDAKCFVQNDDGGWYKNIEYSDVFSKPNGHWHHHGFWYGWKYVQKGEVIGDWKQTLRLRPEEEKVENKNDWYERGELPPVGTVCEMRRRGEGFAKGSLMYHSAELCVWRFMSSAEIALSSDQCEFRPLQTERERWVKEMCRHLHEDGVVSKTWLQRCYDAGLAKMPEDE